MTQRILVVDDDPLICKGLRYNLARSGYAVVTATNATAAIEQARLHRFDLAILDIGLPDQDGLSLCRHLKAQRDMPVLFLTARRRDLDEIVGLEVGGDDYITKPFNIDVVIAHVRVLLRRPAAAQPGFAADSAPIAAGRFTLDPAAHRAARDGIPLDLAPREFELLRYFLTYPDRVHAADEIVARVWGAEYEGEPQVLYVQIRGLREKIEENPSDPRYLLTLRGVGYKFVP